MTHGRARAWRVGAWPVAAGRGRIAVTLAVVAILIVTLLPGGGGTAGISPWCLTCGDRGLADLLLNIVLFVPLGAALAWQGRDRRRALLVGVLLAAGIELLQTVIPGRAPTLRDIATNAFGCWLGALALARARTWTLHPGGALRRVAFATVAIALTLGGLRWLDTPAHLRSYHWVQWRPLLGDAPRWPGRLVGVQLGDTALPEGRVPPEHPLRDLLDADATLRVEAEAGGPTREWRPIVGLVDSWRVHLVLLGQDGDDLILRLGRRSTYFLLETPTLRFADALRGYAPGTPFTVTLRGIEPGRPCLAVDGRERCASAPTAGQTWRLFIGTAPAALAAWHPLDALMVATLLLPLGLLFGTLPRRSAVPIAATALFGLAACSTWLGYAWPSAVDGVGAALGLWGGGALSRCLARDGSGDVADDARAEDARHG